MKKNAAGIAIVFAAFFVPLLLLSSMAGWPEGRTSSPERRELDLSGTVQCRFSEGSFYALKTHGELYRDGQFMRTLPEDTLDFCVLEAKVYALRSDGLYNDGNRVWELGGDTPPMSVHSLSRGIPRLLVLLANGDLRLRDLDDVEEKSVHRESDTSVTEYVRR